MNPIPSVKRKSFYLSMFLVLLILVGLHLFIVYKANILLPGLVRSLSEGKYELRIQQLKFSYWNASMDIKGLELYPSVDSLPEEYHVQATSLHLKMNSVVSLITGRNIKVLDLEILEPKVDVKRNKKSSRIIKRSELHVLVGLLQQSAIHFLHALQVDKCSVKGAAFRYYPIPDLNNHYNIKNINILLTDVRVSEFENELTGKINISVIAPELSIPDSLKHIQLDKFIWDNQRDLIEVGKFLITQRGRKNLSDSTRVELDALAIKKLYWKEWLQTGTIHVDSLMAENGNMYFSNSATPIKKQQKDSVDLKKLKVWDVIGNLHIGYFSARKIKASVINTEPDWERDNTILGDSLVISALHINPELKTPLSVYDLAIGVESFVDKGKGKKIHTSFTGLKLKGDTLSLNNYIAKTTAKSKIGEGNLLSIPVITMIGLSVRDIMEKKATIREIWMRKPVLIIKGDFSGQKKLSNAIPSNAFDELKTYVDVKKIIITNGSMDYVNRLDGKQIINLKNFNTSIHASHIISSNTYSDALNGINNSSIGLFRCKLGDKEIQLYDLLVDYRSKKMTVGSGEVKVAREGLASFFKGLQIQLSKDFNPFVPSKDWHLRWIQVDTGSLSVRNPSHTAIGNADNNSSNPSILVDSMDLRHVTLDLTRNDWKLNGYITNFNSVKLHVLPKITSWYTLQTQVRNIHFVSNDLDISLNRAELNPLGKSLISECNIFRESNDFSVKASLPLAITGTNFKDSKFKPLGMDFLGLSKPTVELFMNYKRDPLENEAHIEKIFSLGNLMVDDPRIFVTVRQKDETFSFGTSGEKMRGKGLHIQGNKGISGFSMDQLSASFGLSEVNASSRNIFRTGLIDFDLQQISKASVEPLQASVKKFNIGSFKLNRVRGKDTIEFRTGGVYLGEIPKFILQKDSILNTVFKLPPAEILPSTFTYRSPDKALSIYNVTANTKEEFLKWDSLSFQNRLGRKEFFSTIPFEKDYITLSTGKVNAEILRPVIYGTDTTVFVHRLTIDPLDLKVERDKRIKDDTVKYRPLLANSLRKIPFPFRIDSVILYHSTLWHNIIDEKTSKEGTIFFKDVNGPISLVKNFDYQENDSLVVSLDSKLMGRGDLKFSFRQDYNDSLQTFLLNAKMGSLDMKEMNRLLQPLQNVRVDKGVISDLSVKAKGNDLLAYGTMEMFYDDLKVSILRENGNRDRIKSWLANVILRGDNKRSGILYTERAREKAIFNFWGKIAINGLLTNLGVKKNNRQEKRFYRGLQKHQLPEDVF